MENNQETNATLEHQRSEVMKNYKSGEPFRFKFYIEKRKNYLFKAKVGKAYFVGVDRMPYMVFIIHFGPLVFAYNKNYKQMHKRWIDLESHLIDKIYPRCQTCQKLLPIKSIDDQKKFCNKECRQNRYNQYEKNGK